MEEPASTEPLSDLVDHKPNTSHQSSDKFSNKLSADGASPELDTESARKASTPPPRSSKDNLSHAAPIQGLTQYFLDESDSEATFNASVDIVAIHGLATQAPRTWLAYMNGKDDEEGSVNWLGDDTMLPSVVKDARILSYNWNAYYTGERASADALIGQADQLLLSLYDNRQKTRRCRRPIIFVCSCFGGLLLAKALPRAIYQAHPQNENFEPIADYTIGACFLGTPFRGSWEFGTANAKALMKLAEKRREPFFEELVRYLQQKDRKDGGSSPLDELVQVFTEMIGSKKFGFQVLCFYETGTQSYQPYLDKFPEDVGVKPEGFDNVTGYGVPVPEASAALDGYQRIALDAKHNMLPKHNSNKAQGFITISSRIKELVGKAQDYLAERDRAHANASFTLPKQFSDYIKDDGKHENSQKEHHEKWVPETCSTLLARTTYLKWRESRASTTLICEGHPGTGKSVFTSVIVQHLQQQDKGRRRGIAYLYLDYKTYTDPKKHDIDGEVADLLRSILKQLLRAVAYIPQATSTLYRALKESNRQPSAEEAEEHILHVLGTFWARSFVVIDALDECNTMSAERLLEVLAAVQKRTELGIMVTSRPNKAIAGIFEGIPVSSLFVSGDKGDIATFLQRKIKQTSPVLKKRVTEEFIGEIVDTISNLSEGMFELARLQLGFLVHSHTVEEINTALKHFREHRESLSSSEQDNSVKSRVTKLYDYAYEKTMEMIKTMPGAYPELAMKALAWILYGPANFTSDELLHALAIEISKTSSGTYRAVLKNELYDLQDLVRFCAGMLVVEGTSVQLAHYTTREFLVNNISRITEREVSNSGVLQDKVKIEHVHRRKLANFCVAYLALDASSAASGIHCDHESTRYRYAAARPLLVGESPFYKHAAFHIGHYAGNLDLDWNAETTSVFTSFFRDDEKIKDACKVIDQLYDKYKWVAVIDTSSFRGPLALLYAAYHDLASVARFLLKHPPAMVSATSVLVAEDNNHYTPLCWAIRRGNISLMRLLLLYSEVKPSNESRDGPPLVLATYSNDQAALEVLLKVTRTGATEALYLAVQFRLKGLIRCLITSGIDPRSSIWMRSKGYMGSWSKLPGGWASRRHSNTNGYWMHEFDTPLALACRKDDEEICCMLTNEEPGRHFHEMDFQLSKEHQGLVDRIYSRPSQRTQADNIALQLSDYTNPGDRDHEDPERYPDPYERCRSFSLASGDSGANGVWKYQAHRGGGMQYASEQEPWETPSRYGSSSGT